MCQSSPYAPATIGSYSTDEQIVMCLDKLMKGSLLPDDVVTDMNPYQFSPSNLPEGIWYLLHSDENKETELGAWIERGEACRIYEDSKITGWRTTRDYSEGPPLSLKKTNWVMQEYKITQNGQCQKNKPKECRILCRVFDCRGEGSSSELHTKPNDSESILELDCILTGDYLELDDLVGKESDGSSSDNSSRVSITSDECFDSLALLHDLEDAINKDLQEKASNSKFSMVASAKSDKVIVQPATQGFIDSVSVSESPVEAVAHKRQKGDSTDEASTSGHSKAVIEEEKVSHSKNKVKKKYFCFFPF